MDRLRRPANNDVLRSLRIDFDERDRVRANPSTVTDRTLAVCCVPGLCASGGRPDSPVSKPRSDALPKESSREMSITGMVSSPM